MSDDHVHNSASRRLVLAIGIVALVWPHTGQTSQPVLSDQDWNVVQIGAKPVTDAGKVRFAADRISGSAPCNQFSATLDVKGRDLTIGPLITTRKFCHDRMILERAMLDALSAARAIDLKGRDLSMLDGKGAIVLKLRSERP